MKITNKFCAMLLTIVIAFGFLAAIPLTASAADDECIIDDENKSFKEAIDIAKGNGHTIKLRYGFTYDDSIVISSDDKSFTIDLNGKSLIITGGYDDYGVKINKRTLTIKGSGTLTIRGNLAGIYANNGGVFSLTGKATVNVTGEKGPGIIAEDGDNVGSRVYASGAWGDDNVKVEINSDPGGSKINRKITLSSPYNGNYWDEFREGRSRVYLRGAARSSSKSSSSSSSEWKFKNGHWFLYKGDSAQKGWLVHNGSWYYMNSKGQMQTGWVKYNGTWYHLSSSGAMTTGWLREGNTWYFLKAGSGAMATGWLLENGKWYYFTPDGAMVANRTMTIGGKSYQFNAQGTCTNP